MAAIIRLIMAMTLGALQFNICAIAAMAIWCAITF